MVRISIVVLAVYVGLCEVLATTPSIDWDGVPEWVAFPFVVTGFFAVIGLVGFIGNGLIAVGFLLVLWRRWGWRLWRAAAVCLPYWIVTYRLSPKPW